MANYVTENSTPPKLTNQRGDNVESALADLRANALANNASVATLEGFIQISLGAAEEAADAIVVSGQLKDLAGNNLEEARQVLVRSLAETDGKGDITVTVGTDHKVINPATGENLAWLTTNSSGAFEISIANDAAELNLIQVSAHRAVSAIMLLTFA